MREYFIDNIIQILYNNKITSEERTFQKIHDVQMQYKKSVHVIINLIIKTLFNITNLFLS